MFLPRKLVRRADKTLPPVGLLSDRIDFPGRACSLGSDPIVLTTRAI